LANDTVNDVVPGWPEEKSRCTSCDIEFTTQTPDPRCPKCGSFEHLVDVKEQPQYNFDLRFLDLLDDMAVRVINILPFVIKEIKDLYKEKNTGYAGKNVDPHHNLKLGLPVRVQPFQYCYTRMNDKMGRLANVINDALDGKVVVKDGKDAVEEEFRDNAVYGILGIIMYREWKSGLSLGSSKESLGER